jgi:hypothetical protein
MVVLDESAPCRGQLDVWVPETSDPSHSGNLAGHRVSVQGLCSAVGSAVNGTVSGSLLEVPSKHNPAQGYYNRSKSYPKYSMSLANRSLTIFSSSDV